MASPVAQGDVIASKYRVERVLGQGGVGVVVAAVDLQSGQRVALKFLLPQWATIHEVLARFAREARSAQRLRTEHVAAVYDIGAHDGAPYIAMEYLEGRDLAQLLADVRRLPIATAVTYLLQACEAIAEAHAASIVHRDLKPANLFLTKRADGSDWIKVLDFGLAKSVDPAAEALTKTTNVLGTPNYMSPEQLRSSKSVDVRTDLWALGMILYELVTGVVGFKEPTFAELCFAVLTSPVKPPSTLLPEIPRALEASILRALEKDPASRFQTVAEFADAIAPFAPGGDAAAARVRAALRGASSSGPVDRAVPAVPAARATAPTPRVEASPSRGVNVVVAVVAAVAALFVGGGVWFLLASKQAGPSTVQPSPAPSASDSGGSVAPVEAPVASGSAAAPSASVKALPPKIVPAASAARPAGSRDFGGRK